MDSVWTRLGYRCCGCRPQVYRGRKVPKDSNDFVSGHGLAHHNCREAVVAQYAIVGPVLVAGRRSGLYSGGGVLRSQTASVCALRLAPFRYRGYCMSLHRCTEIRGLTRLIQPTQRAARLISSVGLMSLITNIIEISEYFIEFSEDKNELKALIQVAGNRDKWVKAHRYFDQIRNKNLKAIQKKKESLEGLYCLSRSVIRPYII